MVVVVVSPIEHLGGHLEICNCILTNAFHRTIIVIIIYIIRRLSNDYISP